VAVRRASVKFHVGDVINCLATDTDKSKLRKRH
jgi:hypothetical protein